MEGKTVRTHRFKTGPAMMELLHLSDAAAGIIAVARRGIEPIYHLGATDCITPYAIAATLSKHLGRPLLHEELPLSGAGSGALLDWSTTLENLGWKPRHELNAGLRDVATRYLQSNSKS
jgi:nucleoside-diphosphate-sugar epimerase